MKRYQMAWHVIPQYSLISLSSTDSSLIQWFLIELKRIDPKCRVNHIRNDLNENPVSLSSDDSKKGREIMNWLMQELLQRGWEPFSTGDMHGNVYIYYRKEIVE